MFTLASATAGMVSTHSFRVTSRVKTFTAAEVITVVLRHDKDLANAAIYSPNCIVLVFLLVYVSFLKVLYMALNDIFSLPQTLRNHH